MDWATAIFPIENRIEPSDFVERIWRTEGVPDKAMISVAVPHWQIVVVKSARAPTSVFVRGPETKASIVGIPRTRSSLAARIRSARLSRPWRLRRWSMLVGSSTPRPGPRSMWRGPTGKSQVLKTLPTSWRVLLRMARWFAIPSWSKPCFASPSPSLNDPCNAASCARPD